MAQHIFSAERQLIFHITVDGRTRLVQFGERSQCGASSFSTSDEKVAAAIKRHSMYRRGVITEFVKEDEKAGKPLGEASGGSLAAQDTDGEQGGQQPAPHEEPDAANVIEADNFTQAKEAVMKRLGVDKDAVKTPILLQKVAKEAGLTIKYNKK